jgi:hypothetical protein
MLPARTTLPWARSLAFQIGRRKLISIIHELEREVGAALLTRTSRAVVLTEVGADYLARVDIRSCELISGGR